MKFIVSEDTQIQLDGEFYLLEEGDIIEMAMTTGSICVGASPNQLSISKPVRRKKKKKIKKKG